MRSREQKFLPFPADREEPDERLGPSATERVFNPREGDERVRLKEQYGEGAESAALTSEEGKKKKKERDKSIAALRAEIHRKLTGSA